MIQRNCKNCGSPLEHSFNHKCKYCGTLYDFNEPKEDLVKVTPQDLIDIDLKDIIKEPIRDSIILLFSGYKNPMPKIYEYNDISNMYVSSVDKYVRCGFCLELDNSEIEKYGMPYVLEKILASGVRYNEIEKIRVQLLESKLKYYCRGILYDE